MTRRRAEHDLPDAVHETRLAVIEASFISALQQTYSVVGSNGALELPHDAFIPWEKDAIYSQRRVDEEAGRDHLIPGADEYQLMVHPIALGSGKRLFPKGISLPLRIVEAKAFSSGVLLLRYQPDGK